ncbi:DNA translocase FtsK 4TM domain-containing protein, partial [bacterium]|nr:DNA translocase FtsK 4TM domain-containing protein [bacterium]
SKKKNTLKTSPSSRQREPQWWGLSVGKWREIGAFCLLLMALLLLLSLISEAYGQGWVGAIGTSLAAASQFIMGRSVSFVLPVLLILAAFHAFRGKVPFHPFRKAVAGILILLSLCALFSLRAHLYGSDIDSPEAFQLGGVLGNFLTSPEGLDLALLLGPAGAYLVFVAALLLGAMLSTEFLFVPLVKRGILEVRSLLGQFRRLKPVAVLKFDRSGSRVFPSAEGALPERASPRPLEIEYEEEDFEEESIPEEETEEEPPVVAPPPPRITSSNTRARPDKSREEIQLALEMIQTELDFSMPDYQAPPIYIFSDSPVPESQMDREEVLQISGELEKALADFNISARVVAVTQGPVVTQYELQPAPGVKVSRILSLENDIALILRAKSVRIQAPIPGKAAIGVEVPNRKVTPVYFRDLIEADEFLRHPSSLAFVLGKNISGEPVICDLASMPHLLIAGTTGSGKSVCVNTIVSSILFRMPPDKVKLIMIDPKRVELNVYSDIPHLLAPVVNEPRQAAAALLWAVQQMEKRLQTFSELRVRNIDGYNAVVSGKRRPAKGTEVGDHQPLPHIVIIIDELADLMLIAKNEVEDFIVRLAQMSRAAGIHMIIATQRPSVNVLTGIIKANFPSRIAFRVSAKVDSRTILDMNGAETLLGKGDMLFSPGGTKPLRIQGAYVSDGDVEKLTEYLRSQTPTIYEKEGFTAAELAATQDAELESGIISEDDDDRGPTIRPGSGTVSFGTGGQVEFPELQLSGDVNEDEVLYDRGLKMVLETKKASVSMIQRRLKIGFARAGRLMDLMEERGIVGPYLGSKPRQIILDDPVAMLRRLDAIQKDRQDGAY